MPFDPFSPSDRDSPPQFGLKVLFGLLTVICVGLALARLVNPFAWGAMALLVVTIGAHLAASGLGTRLRAAADARRRRARRSGSGGNDVPRPLSGEDYAPTTELSRRRPLGRVVVLAPVLGGLLGAGLGGWGMASYLGAQARLANVSVAAVAAGVLGAIGCFLTATFLTTLIAANAEAWRHDESSRSPPQHKE